MIEYLGELVPCLVVGVRSCFDLPCVGSAGGILLFAVMGLCVALWRLFIGVMSVYLVAGICPQQE